MQIVRFLLSVGIFLYSYGSFAVAAPTCAVDAKERISCSKKNFADAGNFSVSVNKIYTASSCIADGCCWMRPIGLSDLSADCYQSVEADAFGYELVSIKETLGGFTGKLQLMNGGSSVYGADIQQLSLNIIYHTENIVEVKITDANNQRWEIPESVIPRHKPKLFTSKRDYTVSYTNKPFSLQVTRASDGETILNLDSSIIFKDQYIEFSVLSDNNARNTFGFGESTRLKQALPLNNIYTLWAVDLASMFLSENLYGSFPFYIQQIKDPNVKNFGSAHGGLLMNSNGMDVTLTPDRINYKILGGVIDYYVFTGKTAKSVVQQSTEIVGKPAMVPFWSLGFHNCRWGYENLKEIEDIVANYSAAGIPLDTQWFDIDYMNGYRDFTVNDTAYPLNELQSFIDGLHANGQRLVPIIDPGIRVDANGYDAYDKGLELDLFIKDIQGNNYLAQVWPGPVHFPDFLNPKSQDYWTDQLVKLHDLVKFDGIWIDMNEVSNFCNKDGQGQICENSQPETCQEMSYQCCLVCKPVDTSNTYDFPPYNINNFYGLISSKTLQMSTKQYNDALVYNTHNLYGLTEQMATNQALKTITGKRPFVLSRSSFLSTGQHSFKWTGDNVATWYSLKSSIVSMLDFNLFSIPMIGSDICGFIKDTNEELCTRWIEVGAFYPFSRDHNDKGYLPQELYRWNSTTIAAQKALSTKYQLLPYYYSLFYNANQNGIPVIQSLWMNFPSDAGCADIDEQFMVGTGLLVSPVLERMRRSVNAYFPKGLWYDFNSKSLTLNSQGEFKTLATDLTDIKVHVYGGSILPLQQPAMTTTISRQTPFTYLIAFNELNTAEGSLFWDDGEQMELTNYITVQMKASYDSDAGHGVFTAIPTKNTWKDGAENYKVGKVVIMNPNTKLPRRILLNKRFVPLDSWDYNILTKTLTVENVDLTIAAKLELTWE